LSEPDYPADTVAVFDLDGTITYGDTFSGIIAHRLLRRPAAIPKLAPLALPVLRCALGRLDNAVLKAAFLKSFFAGVAETELQAFVREFNERLFTTGLRPRALETIERHRQAGHRLVLLSASPDFYVAEIARRLAFDDCLCTGTARAADNTLTGELATANCRGEEKLARLQGHLGEVRRGRCFVGYGDRETDFHLLKALDRGIVVSPDRRTRSRALQAGLTVVDW